MNGKKYNWILYLISLTIVTTIAVQLYWNYKNYKQNKQYVINEIQESFDSSIEEYFAKLTKESLYTIVQPQRKKKNYISNSFNLDSILKSVIPEPKHKNDSLTFEVSSLKFSTDSSSEFKKMDSVFFGSLLDDIHSDSEKKERFINLSKHPKKKHTTIKEESTEVYFADSPRAQKIQVFSGKKANDSLNLIKGLQTIFITVKNDTLNHAKVDAVQVLSQRQIVSS